MASVVYFQRQTPSTGNCLCIRSTDRSTVENFMYKRFPMLCEKKNVKFLGCSYFRILDRGISYAYMEFSPETSDEKILEVIEQYNLFYADELTIKEVMLEIPTRESLEVLRLL